jgi:aminomethyltransferase
MTTTTELLRTPLYDWHVAHGARMVDFAGWSMPVQYKSIVEEHNATRNAVGIFDISHMGRLQFEGPLVPQFWDSVLTRRVSDIKAGQVRYSLVCNEEGGILDDVLAYRIPPADDDSYAMVVNASNRQKILEWLSGLLPNQISDLTATDVGITDITLQSAMIAVQGPRAIELLETHIRLESRHPNLDLSGMRYYQCCRAHFDDSEILISRTGYTGEDGFEITSEADSASHVWEAIIESASKVGGIAAGLGARDTLRLEAAMPLYGHELSEAINPLQAGLKFAVSLDDRDFIGRDALSQFATDKSLPVRVGLDVEGKRVARQGSPVLHDGKIVGEVTSGTFSPTLNRSIAMAYVQPNTQSIGTELTVDIRGTQTTATVVALPFLSTREKLTTEYTEHTERRKSI